MSFVEDVTIGEGESVPPDTPFTKTWRIQNTGLMHFPMYSTVYVRNYSECGPTTENANFVIALVAELSFAIFVGYRYRCVAPWGYSKVHWWASIWAC